MEIIKAKDICRDFKVGSEIVHALSNVSFSIEKNQFTILKGRSGSGKTTLMNILSGLDQASNGKVYFDGKDITNLNQFKRDQLRREHMGYVFQSIALISMMTALENVELALRISGYPRKDRRERAIDCLKHVGLHKRLNHRAGELSGGEQQRVAIARAIAHHPKVLFADEPTAELDTHMGLQVVDMFKRLIENENVTIIMTTHDPNMIELADSVISLEDGKVV